MGEYQVYRHYPMIEGAIGGEDYIDCSFKRFSEIFAGEM